MLPFSATELSLLAVCFHKKESFPRSTAYYLHFVRKNNLVCSTGEIFLYGSCLVDSSILSPRFVAQYEHIFLKMMNLSHVNYTLISNCQSPIQKTYLLSDAAYFASAKVNQ